MSISETLKKTLEIVVTTAKANPVAAIGVGVGAAAVIGGGVYWKKRRAAKAAAVAVEAAPAATEAGETPAKPDLKVVEGQPAKAV